MSVSTVAKRYAVFVKQITGIEQMSVEELTLKFDELEKEAGAERKKLTEEKHKEKKRLEGLSEEERELDKQRKKEENALKRKADKEKKDAFTYRFEELASGRRKVTDFDNVRNLREWVNEEMLDLWKAHMNVRDWNWWGQRYES